jgi:drug/metabolite transporter (DMT)-like permease
MYYILFFPAMFDLVATALCMYGLLYVNVSVYQMLRGSAIIFVAILKHFALGDKLYKFQW